MLITLQRLKIIQAYKLFWKRGFDFKGTCNRNDCWLGGVLANFIIILFLGILLGVTNSLNDSLGALFSVIYILYSFGQIIPGLSISIRLSLIHI